MTPATLLERARFHAAVAIARHKLRACSVVGRSPRVLGRLWIHGDGKVLVGDRVFFDAKTAPIEIYAWAGATVRIGDDTYIAGGTSIEATRSIVLGARVRLGAFCKVMDNHFHPLIGDRNTRPAPRPVVIEDDVLVGPRAIVMAGAHVARGARVAAGTVVKRMFAPEGSAAAEG